jgi:blue copper oxidase
VKRRDFIKLSGITALGTFAAPAMLLTACRKDGEIMKSSIRITEGDFNYPLPALQTVKASSARLTAKSNTANLVKGKTTRVLGYGDGVLGPVLEINKNEQANIQFTNELNQESNIHWHGLIIPAEMDGGPNAAVSAGAGFNYSFPILQRAGAYWYHPHPHGKTGEQVHKGLAGLFLVRDEEEAALNLPSGENEIPLVLQDKRLYPDYSINYSPNMDEVMSGYFGQYILVNGAWSPVKEVSTKWHRLRVLNGSNARLFNLAFSNNKPFYIIGSDGGLLESAQAVESLFLAPGERADILVDFSNTSIGDEIFLENRSFNGGIEEDLFSLPSSLSVVEPINAANASSTRTFSIGTHAGGGGHQDHGGSASMKGMHTINGLVYKMNRVDVFVKSGDTEIWEFDNSMGDEIHPMHVHGLQFQVLERLGGRAAIEPIEKGWKDTVLVMPKEKVKVIMVFPAYKGIYMLHCHNLEHEDDGMMINFKIV